MRHASWLTSESLPTIGNDVRFRGNGSNASTSIRHESVLLLYLSL